ncbi:MAG: molybdopterin oxidoreductase, partial [Anaerovoracaceae bacterium]
IALLSGHIGSPRDGILQVKPKNNSQGLVDMGIRNTAAAMEGVKALLVFGEDPAPEFTEGLEFLMVCDTHPTKTVERADVVIPGTGFASIDGTFTNTERRLLPVESAIDEDFGFEETEDISLEMDDLIPAYKYAEIGEVLGGVLAPVDPEFKVVGSGMFADPKKSTDNLLNIMDERLPRPVKMTE